MKIITQPSVYLIGRSSVDDAELGRFLADHDVADWQTDTEVGGEKLVEVAGRLCYMSFAKPRPGGNSAYTQHILEAGHGSVLEHSVFTLLITGVSRSFTHELVRHRAGMGYSQLSQRYVDEGNTDFVVPPALEDEVKAGIAFFYQHYYDRAFDDYTDAYDCCSTTVNSTPEARAAMVGLRWLAALERDIDNYSYFTQHLLQKYADIPDATLRRKKAREAARSVLPNATETKIAVTGNARALRHFIEMRGSAAADAEIRRVALAVLGVLRGASPNLFGDYKLNQVNGEPSVTTPHAKV